MLAHRCEAAAYRWYEKTSNTGPAAWSRSSDFNTPPAIGIANGPSPTEPGPRNSVSVAVFRRNERNTSTARPKLSASYPFGAPPITANVGSFMNSLAAIRPPTDFVYSNNSRACSESHTPFPSRWPDQVATDG